MHQGRFAGIVALKAPVVAGTGPVAPQATLVPADAGARFLQAQGIVPAAGHLRATLPRWRNPSCG